MPLQTSPLRAQIRALRAADPRVSASEMARLLGCSRQRVIQLLSQMGLPTTARKFDPLCPICFRLQSQHDEPCKL